MNFVDSHTHISALTMDNLSNMYLAGIRTVVAPIQLGCGRPLQPETIVDVWNSQFEKHFKRCKQAQITPYSMLGISMVATPAHGEEYLCKVLEEFLSRAEVVAIGEVGFEPGSATNQDHDYQRKLLQMQIELAKKTGKVINIHTPNASARKIEATNESLQMCKESGMDMSKVVIDHCSIDNLDLVLSSGAYASISVQPWRGISPETAAGWVLGLKDSERVMVDSDSSELVSDPIAVAKTAAALSKKGAPKELIEAVCGGNAMRAYRIS